MSEPEKRSPSAIRLRVTGLVLPVLTFTMTFTSFWRAGTSVISSGSLLGKLIKVVSTNNFSIFSIFAFITRVFLSDEDSDTPGVVNRMESKAVTMMKTLPLPTAGTPKQKIDPSFRMVLLPNLESQRLGYPSKSDLFRLARDEIEEGSREQEIP